MSQRKKCAVPTCTNNFETAPNINYFMFPRNENLRRQWLTNIGNLTLIKLPYESYRYKYSVCEEHFEDNQFQTSMKQKLNRGAVPKRSQVVLSPPRVVRVPHVEHEIQSMIHEGKFTIC